MKNKKRYITIIIGVIIILVSIIWLFIGKNISVLFKSLNSFKDKNLAYTFQHTPEIQPTLKIEKSNKPFEFRNENNSNLPDGFYFAENYYPTETFINETETSAMIVIENDVIKYEKYFRGGDENTVFSSCSMGKSFVSALIGIAVSEGYITSIDDPLGKYITEFIGTDLENIPIKACLQMASGINFDEDKDMSQYSIKTLIGIPAMKVIAKYGTQEKPFTHRRYLSINTEILGQIIKNSTGKGLAEYMEEKLWKKIGSAHDAYWTLSNGTELAMGGLSLTLRDYARFARLYLNNGIYDSEQIISKEWIKDSLDISAEYSKPGANNDINNTIGYGYQWWIPDGKDKEFMAIGVYGQFIYVNPVKNIIIVKTNADPNFMSENYELKHIEFFRSIADKI